MSELKKEVLIKEKDIELKNLKLKKQYQKMKQVSMLLNPNVELITIYKYKLIIKTH
jgi:hypothetical protein